MWIPEVVDAKWLSEYPFAGWLWVQLPGVEFLFKPTLKFFAEEKRHAWVNEIFWPMKPVERLVET